MKFRCPNCKNLIHLADSASPTVQEEVECPSCHSRFDLAADRTATHRPGERLRIGHFETREVLGEGAFGTVFRAWDDELQRFVALKVPRDRFGTDSQAAQVIREARTAAAISHANVVKVFEIGQYERSFYIASELIDGIPLSEFIKINLIEPRAAAQLLIKLLRACQVFHEQGIIHRDLKPGNILVTVDHEPYVTDFGLARRENLTEATVTKSGRIIGTPAYLSPEQARGDIRAITNRSDIYAMGVILYEMLTGKKPFRATDTRTLLHAILTQDPVPLRKLRRSIPRDLETICRKAMEKAPSLRYATAGEMADDLQRFLEGRPIAAKPAGPLRRIGEGIQRNKAVTAGVMVALIPSLIAAYLLALGGSAPGDQDSRTTHPVQISCRLAGGSSAPAPITQWAFAPRDDTGAPSENNVVRATGANDVRVELAPGEYLVVVSVPGVGFHEVYRTVPQDENSASSALTPKRFRWMKGGVVELPPVEVVPTAAATAGMARIEGGMLRTGVPGNPFMPPFDCEVDDFYLAPTEVSYDEYVQILPEPSAYAASHNGLAKGTAPVVGISWYQAAHFAEATHRRLISEFEWEFAATNGGTTTYPWGQDAKRQPEWGAYPLDLLTADVTPTTIIRRLYSGVAEMTSSVLAPYPGGELSDVVADLAGQGFVYRGGPAEPKELDAEGKWPGSPTDRMSRTSRDDTTALNLGFRCGRSVRPRFINP